MLTRDHDSAELEIEQYLTEISRRIIREEQGGERDFRGWPSPKTRYVNKNQTRHERARKRARLRTFK